MRCNNGLTPSIFFPMSNETLEDCIKRVEIYFEVSNPFPIEILREAVEIFSGWSFTEKNFNRFVYDKINNNDTTTN